MVWDGVFTFKVGVFVGSMVGVGARVALATGVSISVGVEGWGVIFGRLDWICGVAVAEQAISIKAKKAIRLNLSKIFFISTSQTHLFNN
jgi:hypothetical protein